MPNTLVIDSSKYAIYVRVLTGQADGPLVTIDANGHIHIGPGGPGDPTGVSEKVQAAARQIQAGADAFHAAMAGAKTRAA
jgi:hypothetical protein